MHHDLLHDSVIFKNSAKLFGFLSSLPLRGNNWYISYQISQNINQLIKTEIQPNHSVVAEFHLFVKVMWNLNFENFLKSWNLAQILRFLAEFLHVIPKGSHQKKNVPKSGKNPQFSWPPPLPLGWFGLFWIWEKFEIWRPPPSHLIWGKFEIGKILNFGNPSQKKI